MKHRLLYITNGITGSGGLERVLSVLTRQLADRYEYEIHIVTLNEGQTPPFYDFSPSLRLHDVRMSGNPLGKLAGWAGGIRKVLREVKPDLVAVCDDGLKGFFIPFLRRGIVRCPIIYERHVSQMIQTAGQAPSFLMRCQFRLMRALARRFDRFVVLTKGNAKEWPLDNLEVIGNPLPFYPGQVSSLQRKSVIAVGKICIQKNYGALLEAWKKVREKFPDWTLNIYGAEKDGGFFRETVSREGLGDSLFLYPPTGNIEEAYRQSSLCVVSSLFEGFGMMLAEAMACGVPCVSFDCPHGPSDIIKHGEDGLLAEPGDTAALAAAMERLMGDEPLRQSMGKAARLNVKRFDAGAIAAVWHDLFESLIRKGGRS